MTGAVPSPETLAAPHADDWGATVRETHSAVVILLGDRGYKIKKPVDLGFLDFRTRESRQAACHRELVLNRRMAPDVYLGVADVVGTDGAPCEHVLVMRRMPDHRRLSTLVRQREDVSADLRHLAKDLASFHATAHSSAEIAESGTPTALLQRWSDNIRTLRELKPSTLSDEEVDHVEWLAMDYLAGRRRLLESRLKAGLVRDGHGDLLADDIFCLPDGPRALDCLDFDDRLRWMDVLDDVACLAMDLERLGDPSAGATLLHDYAEFSGTPQPLSLRHHYIAYRAVMRAKIAALRADARGEEGRPDAQEAAQLCRIGLRHLQAGQVRLVLVGGAPASGKTTLANALGDALPAAVLSSDRLRKELTAPSPARHQPAPFGEGIYSPAATRRTYDVLAQRAASLLAMGESVIVDASFTRAETRVPFREVASATTADLLEIRCAAPSEALDARLNLRLTEPDELSDADIDIGRRLAANAENWPQATVIHTGGSPAEATSMALDVIDRQAV